MATAWHSGAPPAQPHGRAAPGSPAALLSSGSGPPGSTCTRSWVRRRTQEPKVALRPVARRGSSTLSRYSLSSQARGLTPSGSARPTRLRAGCLCLGHGTAGSRRAQGTWAGDALHQGVHQGLPERPAQCPGCLVVRKEAVGKALLVLQRPVQSATATGQHTVPGAGELPRESRAHWWLPALPLAKARRLRGPIGPQQPGRAPRCLWDLPPMALGALAAPAKRGLCRACGHEILLCLADLCHIGMCRPLWGTSIALWGVSPA